jgi:hypothetical protein
MTIGGLVIAAILLAIAWLNESAWLRKFVLGGVAIWFAFYFTMLLGFSFFSEEKNLGRNEPKEFCGFYLDCHMHTAVSQVRTGEDDRRPHLQRANSTLSRLTYSATRHERRSGLHTVDAHVVDAAGGTYTRDLQAEEELGPQPEFEQEVGPEENFDKEIVFDLPVDVNEPRLDIREGYGSTI